MSDSTPKGINSLGYGADGSPLVSDRAGDGSDSNTIRGPPTRLSG